MDIEINIKDSSSAQQTKRLSDAMKYRLRLLVVGMTLFSLVLGACLLPFSVYLPAVMLANYVVFLLALLPFYKKIMLLAKYYLFFGSWVFSTPCYWFFLISFVYSGEKTGPLMYTIFILLYGLTLITTYFISYRYWDKKWNEYKDFNLTVALNLEKAQYDIENVFEYQGNRVQNKQNSKRRKPGLKDKIKEIAANNVIPIAIFVQVIAFQLIEHGFSMWVFYLMSLLSGVAGICFLSFSVMGIHATMKIREYEKTLHAQIENHVNE